jgi:hypothetical protein
MFNLSPFQTLTNSSRLERERGSSFASAGGAQSGQEGRRRFYNRLKNDFFVNDITIAVYVENDRHNLSNIKKL